MKHILFCALTALSLAAPALAQEKASSKEQSSASKESAAKEPAAKAPAAKGASATTGSSGAVVDSKMEILRQKIKTDKKYVVSENMDLTAAEAKSFWPIYDSYQKDLQKLNQRIETVVHTYLDADAKGPVSNNLCKKLVADQLEIEKSELDAKRAMLAKAGKVLPAFKVAKYAQMENKMRALVKYELAVNIPLVE